MRNLPMRNNAATIQGNRERPGLLHPVDVFIEYTKIATAPAGER